MFNWAIEWGYVKENPVKKVKLEKENNVRTRFLEIEELKKLLNVCDEPLKPVVILVINTGMRSTEAQKVS